MKPYLLVQAAAFRMLPGFVRDILDLHLDCRIHLDICVLLPLHILVEVLHYLPLHMLVEGWQRTLLVVGPPASRAVPHTLGWSVHKRLVVALLGQVDVLAKPLVSLGFILVVLVG